VRTVVAILMGVVLAVPPSPAPSGHVDTGRFVLAEATPKVITVVLDGDPARQAERLSKELGTRVLPLVIYRPVADPSAEPRFGDQWALRNTGQTGGLVDADIDADLAWPFGQGQGVTIATIDSGIETTDADLSSRLWTNSGEVAANGIDDDQNGFVDDVHGWDFFDNTADITDVLGHGTAVASVAAAAANGEGMTGVAPLARLMPVKACGSFGCPADTVASAIRYAVDEGAGVINISLGAPGWDPLVADAVAYARDRDVVVVVAAGNAGYDVEGPVFWTPVEIDEPNLVGVAWSNDDDTLDDQSNYGTVSVDLAAPGGHILTALLGPGYDFQSGTSFAAPHVAGVAALMRALDPDMSAEEVAALLSTTAEPEAALVGKVASAARLNALTAAEAARFRDIPSTTFALDALWAGVNHVAAGCDPPTDRLFCPDDDVTRGQLAAFITRAYRLPATATDFFVDDQSSVFENDINRLAAAGITTGCSKTSFCPDLSVTRGQAAAMIARAEALPAPESDHFTDDDGSVFETDINRLADAGILKGCNPPANDRSCPSDLLSRGAMVALLHRAA
jgi:subtilisin family serine protease